MLPSNRMGGLGVENKSAGLGIREMWPSASDLFQRNTALCILHQTPNLYKVITQQETW